MTERGVVGRPARDPGRRPPRPCRAPPRLGTRGGTAAWGAAAPATAAASRLARSAASSWLRRMLLGAPRHRLAAGLEHGLQRLSAGVGGCEEEIVARGPRFLELLHQRQRHGPARHRPTQLGIDAIASGSPE